MKNPRLNRDKLGWGQLATEFISVEAGIYHYHADEIPQAYAKKKRVRRRADG